MTTLDTNNVAERLRKLRGAHFTPIENVLVGEAADLIRSLSEHIDVLEGVQQRMIAQYRIDLSTAHAEICKLQKLDPATHSWPDWTPQANTLRWFDELERASSLTKEGK